MLTTTPPPTDPVAYQAWLDEYLTPTEAAVVLKMVDSDGSTQNGEEWLQRKRSDGSGPPYKRPSPKIILYRRRDLVDYLDANTHQSTSEYRRQRPLEAPELASESTDEEEPGV